MGTHKDKKTVVDIFGNLEKHGFKINDTMSTTLNNLLNDGYYTYNSFDTTEIDNHIIKMLDIDTRDDDSMHEVKAILDEIKTKCEYDKVVFFINKLKKWGKYVRHIGGGTEASNAKQLFQNAKKRILKDLEMLENLNYAVSISDIKKRISDINFNRPRYDVLTKKKSISLNKTTLYKELIVYCGTPKSRASKIKNILDKLAK